MISSASQILVTGGGGYLGSVLCAELLRRGHSVTVLESGRTAGPGLLGILGHPRLSLVVGDVRNRSVVLPLAERSEAVVHLAAVVGQAACDAAPDLAKSINVDGTETVVNSLSRDQILVFLSTSSVYGQSAFINCDESTPASPGSLYSALKLQSEQMVLDHQGSIVVRPATLFGGSGSMRYDLLPHRMMLEGLTNRLVTVHEPHYLRSFLHVRDAASVIAELSATKTSALAGLSAAMRIANLAQEDSHVTKLELAKIVCAALGCGFVVRPGYRDPDSRNYRILSSSRLLPSLSGTTAIAPGLRDLALAMRVVKP